MAFKSFPELSRGIFPATPHDSGIAVAITTNSRRVTPQ